MRTFTIIFLAISLALTGCATNRVSEEKYSGFLKDYSNITTPEWDKDVLSWIDKKADFSKYNSLVIDDVLIITPDGRHNTKDKTLLDMAKQLKQMMISEAAKKFTVVAIARPQSLQVQAAITGVYKSYDDFHPVQYLPIAAVITGAMRTTGASLRNVRVMAEIRLVDAHTKRVLAKAIDLKTGKEMRSRNAVIKLADVEPVLSAWSKRLVSRLTASGMSAK